MNPSTTPGVWDQLAQAASPLADRPRVVPGLEIARHTTRDGEPYIVLRNPAAATYLKVEPYEYDLIQLMDGSLTIPVLVLEDFKRRHVMAPPRVLALVQALHAQRFLTRAPFDAYAVLGERLAGHAPATWLQRAARAFFSTEFSLPHVDAWMGAAYRNGGWVCFTRPVAAVLIALAAAGPVALAVEFARGRYTLGQTRPESAAGLLLLFVLSWLVLLLHEIGHGLVVKHAGRTIRRGGLLIYYGLPGAFVDTTDIWMAPRRMRLLVSLAGPFTAFVAGGVLALGAALLPEGPLGAALFAGAWLFLINDLLNFNPLLELDGYYLLVDWVEKPLLRARALAFARGPLWDKLRRRAKLSGEEILFAWFGLASAVWSVVAIVLALQIWARQLQEPILALWNSGDAFARAVLVLAGVLLGVPLASAAMGALRRLGQAAATRVAWLRRRVAARHDAEALALLKMTPLWEDLPGAQLARVAHALRIQDAGAGAEIVRQGEPSRAYYLLARGECEVFVDGRPVRRLRRSEDFGKRALLDDAPQPASVVAVQAARLYTLDRASFRAALADDLERAVQLEAALNYQSEVGRMALFQNLGVSELREMLRRMQPVAVAAGEELVRPGDADDRFFIVRSGQAEVVQDGRVVETLGPGEAFGEDRLLDLPTTATVRATMASELLALRRADFDALLAVYQHNTGPERLSHLGVETHRRFDEVVTPSRRA
jgi:CRP-like cAMP-binding protein